MNKITILAWVPRITLLLSILGSSAIVYMVISDRKNKLTKPSHRFLLLMSIFDIMQSSAGEFSSIAIPKNPAYPGAMGNETTCAIQGFFLTLGLAVPLYNSSLNFFFLLSIRYSIDPKIFSRKFEPYLHALSILIPLTISITFTVTGNMQPRTSYCYATSRAAHLSISALIMFCIIFCIYAMGQICWTVISQTKLMDKYVFRRVNNQDNSLRSNRALTSNDRETIKQAVMYTFAFFLTWTFPLIGGFIDKGDSGNPIPYSILILTNIFYPLQGLWNFLFYVRPGIKYVLHTTDKSFIGAVQEAVFNGKALSMQRKSSRRDVAQKRSFHKLAPKEAPMQDKTKKTSPIHCNHCLYKSNPETKRTIAEGILIDVENNPSEPEEATLQESLNTFADEDKQSMETRDYLHKDRTEGHFESLDLESCVKHDHETKVRNDQLDEFGHKSDIQPGRQQQRRRSSFVDLASVLCKTDLESFDSSSVESYN